MKSITSAFRRLVGMEDSVPQVTCYPPLGQVTCAKNTPLRFTVVLESDREDWEVQIWHNIGVPEWTALPLPKCVSDAVPLLNGDQAPNSRQAFSDEIVRPSCAGQFQFTVRFRETSQTDWRWVNQEPRIADGELIFASPRTAAENFAEYFENLSSEIEIQTRQSEAPGAVLWHLAGSVDAVEDGNPGVVRTLPLGTPSSVSRFFALIRMWTPWLGPRQGKGKFELNEDALLCSFLRTDGVHVVLLGVSGIDNVLTVLGSGANGEVLVKAQNDNTTSARFQILASAAEDFEVAMSALIYEARKLVRPYTTQDVVETCPQKDPEAQWLSTWADGLTYCTWNGLGQNLTEGKVLSALRELKKHGINITNLIMDDNWQTLDNEGKAQWDRAWKQFEANPKAFPHGLKKTVDAIREENRNIDTIAVWHSLLGYWHGISPEGELAALYKTKEVEIKNPGTGKDIDAKRSPVLAIDPQDVQRFYDDFYRFLSSAGINGVKTDAQYFLDLLVNPEDRRRFTSSYQDAWSISSSRYFDTKVISCMSLFPQNIFHSLLPTNKFTIPVRNSDDFFPDVESSHPWHLFCNAHNALFTRYLNVIPDWDMFQTTGAYAGFHAAARCVSGGPVYITDVPGKHNLDLINQITAPTIQGTTVILRPSIIGRTLDMYHDLNEGHILRVGTYTGRAPTGSGIIGLFNIASSTKSCIIPVSDFPGVHNPDAQYVVRAHTSGKLAEGLHASDSSAVVSVKLEQKGWEILTVYPTQSFTLKGGSEPTYVSVLGLLGKMTGIAALLMSDISIESNGRLRFDVSLKALGILGIYISDLSRWDIEENCMVTISGRAIPQETVRKSGGKKGKVLEIDLQTAWKELGLDAGWSNEIRATLFIG
ncbi:hypothetical protein ARAM_001531 [Aspergillus rambellii]|uniref:Uncharacterized protein n=1 Tax=Aspergillus rambellii TaxID=308745 RepID=A0A0F8XJT1_9EURO|nr:hypothetical protein ARAM_001531 [Aspergillus rambellii]